jgi:type IV secretion system protein TrbI
MADQTPLNTIPMPSAQTSPGTDPFPLLSDRRVRPEGVVPRQAQAYVVAGLAVLILLAVLFSKSHSRPAPRPAPLPLSASSNVNQRKIQELEQDLSADQRRIEEQAPQAPPRAVASPLSPPGTPSTELPQPAADPIADAERDMLFKSRFASNLVSVADTVRHPSDDPEQPANDSPPGSSRPTATEAAKPADNKHRAEVDVIAARGQPYVVFEGTTIDTVLLNRLDAEFTGPVKVMVTNPVYSQDRQHTLIPEGTFILGEAQKVAGFGQRRLAVAFHRMLMPDGYSVDLDQFHGLDQAGASGLKDKVNNHYAEIFGASIALGVIAGAGEATNLNSGYSETGAEAYKAGVASSLSQSSAEVLDRFMNIPPTITIREGHRIKVYITEDLLLPAYENHVIPSQF